MPRWHANIAQLFRMISHDGPLAWHLYLLSSSKLSLLGCHQIFCSNNVIALQYLLHSSRVQWENTMHFFMTFSRQLKTANVRNFTSSFEHNGQASFWKIQKDLLKRKINLVKRALINRNFAASVITYLDGNKSLQRLGRHKRMLQLLDLRCDTAK